MNIAIIGCGSIGTTLAKATEEMQEIEKVYIFDRTGICQRIAENNFILQTNYLLCKRR